MPALPDWPASPCTVRRLRFGAKPDKKIVDRQAASPSSWKTPPPRRTVQYREFHGIRAQMGFSPKYRNFIDSSLVAPRNFLRPCRELSRASRRVSAVIREPCLPPKFI